MKMKFLSSHSVGLFKNCAGDVTHFLRTCCWLVLPPRALQVSSRDGQHEHGEVYRRAQEACPAAPSGLHRRRRGRAGEAAVHLSGGPAFLQLVPDPPQARREQLGYGARRGAAGAAGGVAGQEQRLVYRQPTHLLRVNDYLPL